jgi:hypothetical protein
LERALREKQGIAARYEVVDQLLLQLAGELDKIRQLLLHLLDLVQGDHLLHLVPQRLQRRGQLEMLFHLALQPPF